jgi:hypothetical protein
MKIHIAIEEASYGRFSKIKLNYANQQGQFVQADLHLEFLPLYDFEKDTSSPKFDFFLISTLVYGIDNLLNREEYSIDGWAREIEVTFPVQNLELWHGNEEILTNILKFLTGDYWTVSFEKLSTKVLFIPKSKRWAQNIPQYNKNKVKQVSLFSGGLDSLIGIIDTLQLLGNNEKILLVSHFDSHSVGPNSDQTSLEAILTGAFQNKIYWVQSTVTLARKDSNGADLILEDSYRSRSLLFIGIGLYLLTDNISTNELLIPENGTISLNYPLTPSRVSSLNTRTTHPYVLASIQKLVSKVLGNKFLRNPYSLKTKGEMVINCLNQAALLQSFAVSVSCGKRGRKTHWDIKTGTHHCGVCMPCVYRRAALHKKGIDNQVYGNDLLTALSIDRYVDMAALFDYLKTPLSHEKIKRDLVVNGSLPLNELDNYANVVMRSRTELLKWFSDKGNAYIKKELGIK